MFETDIIDPGARCLGPPISIRFFQKFEKINIGHQMISDDGHDIRECPFLFCFSLNDQHDQPDDQV